MQRALQDLKATAWLSGLRAEQTLHRKTLSPVDRQGALYKIHPILNWTSEDIESYFEAHDLPQHPLRSQGYMTVGDWHSSRPLTNQDKHERETCFHGLKQECGLHLPINPKSQIALSNPAF